MKFLLVIMLFFVASCTEQDNEEKKDLAQQIKDIKAKPFDELTPEERNLLIMILETNKSKEETQGE
jgi:thioredoxin-related protein